MSSMNVYYQIKKPILLRLKDIRYGYSIIFPNQLYSREKFMDTYILKEIVYVPDPEFGSIIRYDKRDINNIIILKINENNIPWLISEKENEIFKKYFSNISF